MFLSNLMLFPKSIEPTEKEKIQRSEILDRLIKVVKENVDGIHEISRINFELAKIQMEGMIDNKYSYLLLAYPSYLLVSGVFRDTQPHDLFWLKIIHKTDMFTKQSPIATHLGIPISFEVESNYPERAIEIFGHPESRKFIANMGEGNFNFFPVAQIIKFKDNLGKILELTESEQQVLREIDRAPTALIKNPTAMGVYRKAMMKEEELTKFQLAHVKESWDLEAFELIRRAERSDGRYWDDLNDPTLYSMAFCSEIRDFSLERKAIYSLYAIHEAITRLIRP